MRPHNPEAQGDRADAHKRAVELLAGPTVPFAIDTLPAEISTHGSMTFGTPSGAITHEFEFSPFEPNPKEIPERVERYHMVSRETLDPPYSIQLSKMAARFTEAVAAGELVVDCIATGVFRKIQDLTNDIERATDTHTRKKLESARELELWLLNQLTEEGRAPILCYDPDLIKRQTYLLGQRWKRDTTGDAARFYVTYEMLLEHARTHGIPLETSERLSGSQTLH